MVIDSIPLHMASVSRENQPWNVGQFCLVVFRDDWSEQSSVNASHMEELRILQ